MLTIENAKNPIFSDKEKSMISLDVKFKEFDAEIPFTASPFDKMPYGVELYERSVSGEFGEIADYVPPPVVEEVK